MDTWMTPEDAQCKEFESGAKLCDNPDGTTFVWVVKDRVMWLQYPDGSKSWMMHPHKVFRPKKSGYLSATAF